MEIDKAGRWVRNPALRVIYSFRIYVGEGMVD